MYLSTLIEYGGGVLFYWKAVEGGSHATDSSVSALSFAFFSSSSVHYENTPIQIYRNFHL